MLLIVAEGQGRRSYIILLVVASSQVRPIRLESRREELRKKNEKKERVGPERAALQDACRRGTPTALAHVSFF